MCSYYLVHDLHVSSHVPSFKVYTKTYLARSTKCQLFYAFMPANCAVLVHILYISKQVERCKEA